MQVRSVEQIARPNGGGADSSQGLGVRHPFVKRSVGLFPFDLVAAVVPVLDGSDLERRWGQSFCVTKQTFV